MTQYNEYYIIYLYKYTLYYTKQNISVGSVWLAYVAFSELF